MQGFLVGMSLDGQRAMRDEGPALFGSLSTFGLEKSESLQDIADSLINIDFVSQKIGFGLPLKRK